MSAFGRAFALGVEEELIVVDAQTLALSHTGVEAMDVPAGAGSAHPDTYAALVELASPVVADAREGVASIARIAREGAGADRQRAAFARGGMRAVLELLVAETAATDAYR